MLETLSRSARKSTSLRLGGLQVACTAACLILSLSSCQAALLGSCTILVGADGTLRPNTAIDTLSSANPGGSTAKATIVTTGPTGVVLPQLLCTLQLLINCYTVSVVSPSGFSSSPIGGNTNVTFASSFTIESVSGLLSRVLLNGTYPMEVSLTATRSGGMFPVGSYTVTPTVRCE